MQTIIHFKTKVYGYSLVFWSIVLVGVIFISSSHPMMKLRFDIWQHIGSIDALVLNSDAKIIRSTWHATWALLFRTLDINDIFVYAITIHRIQFFLSCILIYYAARLLFSALLPVIELGNKNRRQWLSSLAISSVLVWLTIIGTVSTFQQAWIMWYSVNYQITLPLFFLSLCLFINAISFIESSPLKAIKLFISFALLILVYFYHAAELAYLVIYAPLILICFSSKNNYKKILMILAVAFILLFLLSINYNDRMPSVISLVKSGNFHKIKNEINLQGLYNIQGGNRYSSNWNELYAISVYSIFPICLFAWTKNKLINHRVLCLIGLSLVFCFIPTFKYSSGLVSLISYNEIVNRYYFASFVFILLPLATYFLISYFKKLQHPAVLIVLVVATISLVFMYSKIYNKGGVYYQNVKSIRDSLYEDRVGVNLPVSEIESIGRQIREAENKYGADKVHFCTSYDKAHIVWYVYRQKNMRFDRNGKTYEFPQCVDDARPKNKTIIVID
jgi:hypothetical protein